MSSTNNQNNKKVLYQLCTNGKGSFAVGKIGSQLIDLLVYYEVSLGNREEVKKIENHIRN